MSRSVINSRRLMVVSTAWRLSFSILRMARGTTRRRAGGVAGRGGGCGMTLPHTLGSSERKLGPQPWKRLVSSSASLSRLDYTVLHAQAMLPQL
jgi:hypothetical protein